MANTVPPQKVCYFFTVWNIWKDLETSSTKHGTTFFETPSPNEITSKKTIDIHLENHGENQAHIGSIGLHHTFKASRSIATAEDLLIFWEK